MTLILAGAIGGKYSITTGDTRRSMGRYWEDKNTGDWGVEDGWEKTDRVVNKVTSLTNYVTCAQAGNSDITEHIIKTLKQRVSKDEGVMFVGLKLQEIITEMRKKLKSGLPVPFYYNFIDDPDQFGIVLNGFTNEIIKGKSCFCFYISGFDEDVHTEEIEDNEYSYIIWAPAGDYAKKKEDYMNVKLNSDKEDIKRLTNQFLKVHAVISSLQPNEVSELCDYEILKWESAKLKPEIEKNRVDVSKSYKELGLV